jgi:serine/threonine-protein kinase
MQLSPGTRLGAYEIVGLLGAGGMGEVYRAVDTRLDRHVAVKVLPEAFASDPERTARFQREAKVLASLNHPHIAALFGLEESDGRHFLTMELVEGDTLADRIARGPLAVDEALPIARQIAEALEAAHEQGIVHRDLKPANIKVRPDGTVKVLDFGLAKALGAEPGGTSAAALTNSPTIASPAVLSGVGVVLGTAAYMSPEQARGKPIDKRADIWAFGCVLFEMLTATCAFPGDGISDVIASVLRAEPTWSALPTEVPQSIRTLLSGCLEKDAATRISSMAVVRYLLGTALQFQISPPSFSTRSWAARAGIAAVLVAVGVAAGLIWERRVEPAVPTPVVRTSMVLPPDEVFQGGERLTLAISPDGSRVAYVASNRLYLRRLDQLTSTPIPGTEGESTTRPRNLFFSPDGRWLGFWHAGQLKRLPVDGGPPITICSLPTSPLGASWGSDDVIVYSLAGQGIWRVAANGGTPEVLIADPGGVAHGPQRLADSNAVLYTLNTGSGWGSARTVVHRPSDPSGKVVVEGATDGRLLGSGYLVYATRGPLSVTGGTLMAARFNQHDLRVDGGAVRLVDNVIVSNSGAAQFSVSDTGTLLYAPSLEEAAKRRMVWVSREGVEIPVPADTRSYTYPRISPDGLVVAVDDRQDLWLYDISRATLRRLTIAETQDFYPVWSRDGQWIAFASGISGPEGPHNLFRLLPNGSGQFDRLTTSRSDQIPHAFTHGDSSLIFRAGTAQQADIHVLSLTPERATRELLAGPYNERNPDLSADGRFIAYESDESGSTQIYVRPFPDIDRNVWPISSNGGAYPVWARRGHELFYEARDGSIMAAAMLLSGSNVKWSPPAKLFSSAHHRGQPGRTFDVAPDGRFLMIKGEGDQTDQPSHFVTILNWIEELKLLLPGD